jgi:hypothetical protein
MEYKEWKEKVMQASTMLRSLMNVDDLHALAQQSDEPDLLLKLWEGIDEDLEYLQVVLDRT